MTAHSGRSISRLARPSLAVCLLSLAGTLALPAAASAKTNLEFVFGNFKMPSLQVCFARSKTALTNEGFTIPYRHSNSVSTGIYGIRDNGAYRADIVCNRSDKITFITVNVAGPDIDKVDEYTRAIALTLKPINEEPQAQFSARN